ncbi:MAG TPA: hypothetical protein PKM50_00420 [Methanoregula sp.]|nr:hypothetical protein [Methanoregula sp.]
MAVSIISFFLTCGIFFIVGWAVLYPLAIAVLWFVFMAVSGKHRGTNLPRTA